MASQMLDIAEAYDGYQRRCKESPLNAVARKICVYKPSFLPPEEAARLNTIIVNTDLLRGTDTIILDSSADNGYPHTRPKNIICLPASFVSSSKNAELKQTLCHEAMHVNQRQYPEIWNSFCKREGWTPLTEDAIPVRFREKCRLNPDTLTPTRFWAWDTHYVPLPMFTRDIHITLADVKIEWFDLRSGALFHSAPESFTKKYGSPPQPEHPYELYAVIFAEEEITSRNDLLTRLSK